MNDILRLIVTKLVDISLHVHNVIPIVIEVKCSSFNHYAIYDIIKVEGDG